MTATLFKKEYPYGIFYNPAIVMYFLNMKYRRYFMDNP